VPPSDVASIYTGEGFDACSAPSLPTIAAWAQSPYRSLGIYIGGINRACSQPNLNPTWIRDVLAAGWSLVPIYVGLQAPCSGFSNSIDPNQADAEGQAAADDAALQASLLGIAPANPIYLDMEGYNTGVPGCSQGVLAFLNRWTAELHAKGYVSGVYGSSASTMSDLVQNYSDPVFNSPDEIWFANWSCCPHLVYGDPYVPDADWSPHRRLHQYFGGHNETWGGVTINIDSDYSDGGQVGGTGLLNGGVPGYVLDGWGGIHPFGGASRPSGGPYWPGWDIARGIAAASSPTSGYVLDGWGGIHPFRGAGSALASAYWPGWDIARAIALNPCDSGGASGYVLDGWGGVHPFGGAPVLFGSAYWRGWDIARSMALSCGAGVPSGYVLDGWGGLHPLGAATATAGSGYWPGEDVAVGVVLTASGGGYVLDHLGGMHPFGGAPDAGATAYWPGSPLARGAASASGGGGYVLDAYGSLHKFGQAPPEGGQIFTPGIARGVTVAG
jgi:hypothetical protein